MQIPINKDIEVEYKDQLALGFSLKELVWILMAGIIIAGVGVFAWSKFHVTPEVAFYIGMPFGAIPIFIGFKKFQGMTLMQYLKEVNFEKKTRDLSFDAGEISEAPFIYSVKKNEKDRGRKR